jgi:hypothetical protein
MPLSTTKGKDQNVSHITRPRLCSMGHLKAQGTIRPRGRTQCLMQVLNTLKTITKDTTLRIKINIMKGRLQHQVRTLDPFRILMSSIQAGLFLIDSLNCHNFRRDKTASMVLRTWQ